MALVVEDGGGLSNANGYIDTTFADEYHDNHGHAGWAALSTAEKETSIVRATSFVDKRFGMRYVGFRRSKSQNLEWPRLDAFDKDGFLLSGEDEIPRLLKRAVAEYALRAAIYNILAPDPLRAVPGQDFSDLNTAQSNRSAQQAGAVKSTRVKAGPVESETEYQTAADMAAKSSGGRGLQSGLLNDFYIPEYPEADMWIEELLRSGQTGVILSRGD